MVNLFPVFIGLSVILLTIVCLNGMSDIKYMISPSLSTHQLPIEKSVLAVGAANFLGVLVFGLFCSRVMETMFTMVRFTEEPKIRNIAFLAIFFTIFLNYVIMKFISAPTSESHALIAGLTGSAIAINGGKGICLSQWGKILMGIVLSTIVVFVLSYSIVTLIKVICRDKDRRQLRNFFEKGQFVTILVNSFCHGAQNGQKFLAVWLLILHFSRISALNFSMEVWHAVFLGMVMWLGIYIGGRQLRRRFGVEQIYLEDYEGFSSGLGAIITTVIALVFGIPISTTHTSTVSVMGVGASKRLSNVNWSYAGQMALSWVLVFPCCGLVSYVFTKILLFL